MEQQIFYNSYCPVPENQRPLNEFLNLKQSFYFKWLNQKFPNYLFRIILLSIVIFIFSVPIANFYYCYFEYPTKFIFLNCFIIIIFQTLIIIRICLTSFYIKERLNKPFIEYEESSWYDCQTWVKSIKVLKQDRLIYYYNIFPIINRLKKIIVYLILVYNIGFIFNILI